MAELTWLDTLGGGDVVVQDDIVKSEGTAIDTVAGLNGVPIIGIRGSTPEIGAGLHYNQVGEPGHKLKKGVMPGHVDLVDFGAIPGVDDAPSRAANDAAWQAAMNSMSAPSSNLGQRLIAHGDFYFNDTIHVTKSLWIQGTNSSFGTHAPATRFIFPKDCDGIRFHAGGADIAPSGDSGIAGFARISDLSIFCKDHNEADIENATGIPATLQSATGYWRNFSAAPWAGTASAGTSAARGFATAGADPTVANAFRDFADNGGSGQHGIANQNYPKCAGFNGTTQYLVGDASTKVSDLISASAYTLQFILELTAAGAANANIALEPSIFAESSSDAIFVTYSASGIRAGHKDGGGVKVTPYIPVTHVAGKGICVQVRFNGSTLECRVNGVDSSATVSAGNVVGTLSSLTPRIGANGAGTKFITGRIAQILTFNTARTWADLELLRTSARIAYGYTCNRGHGIRTSTIISLSNVHAENFGENGLAIFADGSTPIEIRGNASGTRVESGCHFDANGGHGIHIYGGDASICHVSAASVAGNMGWGVYDESLDGGYHSAIHAEGNRGHQEEDTHNRDYTNIVNSSIFDGCYTESAFNLITGLGDCNGLVAEQLHPLSTGLGIASGIVRSKSIEHRNTRGTTSISTNCMRPGDTMHGFEWAVIGALEDDIDRHSMFYNEATKWWSVESNGYHQRMIQYPTAQAYEREPTVWAENGIKIGRDDASGTPIIFTAETAPRTDKFDGSTKTTQKGDTAWQSQPVVGGPLCQRCLTSGTAGTLNGSATTATTVSGQYTAVLNDYSGLAIGQYVHIAGVTGKKQVLNIDYGTLTITFDTPADASVGPGAAVSYVAPTFETLYASQQPQGPSVAISAYDIDWSAGSVFYKTLGAGAQVFTFSNAADGMTIIVEVTGAASTLTWPSVKWPGGVAPTQTASGTDIYTFVKRGSTIYGAVNQAMA